MPHTLPEYQCLSLVGIAGAGKSTLAPILAGKLGWSHLDTDRLIEANMGRDLQDIYDTLGRDGFLDCERRVLERLAVSRMIVSTGGSVVYAPSAVARLRLLGPVVWLRVSAETFLKRIGHAGGRGFARPEGASLLDVFEERQPLYAAAADLVIDTDAAAPEACTGEILDGLARWNPVRGLETTS